MPRPDPRHRGDLSGAWALLLGILMGLSLWAALAKGAHDALAFLS